MSFVPFFRGLARHLHLACLALTAATATVCAQVNSPSAADGFDPNIDGTVFAIARQENDGKLIVGGQFANISPNGGISIARSNLARLNADGSLDGSFNLAVDGPVRAVVLQPDGRILIGGDFTKVGTEAHAGIARLNGNGTIDSNFKAGVGTSATLPVKPQVFAIMVQPSDGSIVVGGTFGSAVSSSGASQAFANLVRFSPAGALDTTFNPNPNGVVLALASHQAGKIVVGGGFTQFKELGRPAATDRLRIARLNPNGTLDTQFDPKANDGVSALAVQPDGKVLVGGYFTTLQPIGDTNAATRSRLARLNLDGTLDSEFRPGVSGNVTTLSLVNDGSIIVGGRFGQAFSPGGVAAVRPYAAKLATDGTVDEAFNPGVNGEVNAITVQADGKIVLAGAFTRAHPPTLGTAAVRNHIARVLPNGALDAAFQLDPGGRILASVTQADGSVVVGGTFTNIGGLARNYIARVSAAGVVDATYNPSLNGAVYALALETGGKVIAGGAFTKAGTDDRNHIVRLNTGGTVDSEFNPNIDGAVAALVVQKDGAILVGGSFSTAKPSGATDATIRYNLLRLTSAGQIDTAFNPTPNSTVTGIALQGDGRMLIVGSFNTLQPGATGQVHARSHIARVNQDGTIDRDYYPGANSPITTVVVQSDDKAVIGGQFTLLLPQHATAGVARNYLARLNVDGTLDAAFDPHPNNLVLALALQGNAIVVGGMFTTFQPNETTDWKQAKYIGRLKADGTLDTPFNLDLNEQPGSRVDAITVQPNGDLLVGGSFTSLQPAGSATRVLRNHFARITSSGSLDAAFDPRAGGATDVLVRAIAMQTDGKIVVAGKFADFGGANTRNIARFNPEGTADAGFNAALTTDDTVNAVAVRANGVVTPTQLGGFAWLNSNGSLRGGFAPTISTRGRVNATVVQPDGKIILAGLFSDVTNQMTSTNIVRLNPNGTLDTAFNGFGITVDGTINGMALQSDGKLIIVGSFGTVKGSTRNRVARINLSDGSLDGFDPNPDSVVNAVVVQADGNVVLGGAFTSLTPAGDTSATSRNHLVRVKTTGSIDTTYNPNLNGPVYTLALESTGKVIAGGAFTSVQPNTDTTATTRNHVARFEPDGKVDKVFDPNANDVVYVVAIQPADQWVLLGGAFTTLQPTVNGTLQAVATRNHVARVGSDGAVDTRWSAGTNGYVNAMALTTGGAVVVGGNFNAVTESGGTTAIARNHFARFSSSGTLDAQFNPDFGGSVTTAAALADGTLLVGGGFTSLQPTGLILLGGTFKNVGGLPALYVAQLNGDGSVNAAFQPSPNQPVNAVLPLPDGRFIVAGQFTTISGAARSGLARYNADSTLDAGFAPAINGPVTAVALQSDGRLVVGAGGGTGLVRLNGDGSLDASFASALPLAPAVAIVVQADGRIVVAGPGSGVGPRVARLNADGSIDATFTRFTPASGLIESLTLQTDGALVVAGSFPDRLVRLKPDGTVDSAFNPAPNGNVSSLALQSDGRLLIGGSFTYVGGLQRYGIARLGSTGSAAQSLNVSADGKTVTWLRFGSGAQGAAISGTAAELAGATFEYSTDGTSWRPASTAGGTATRIGSTSGWQVTNASVPTAGNVYVRARGIVPTSAGLSAGVYESTRLVNLSSPVATLAMNIAPVVSTVAWDQSHYVWTADGSGVLRIADALSGVVLESTRTALVDGAVSSATSTGRLADLSTRGTVAPNSPLISGFAVTGSGPRSVLVRAAGPALAGFGVADALPLPRLRLYNNTTGAVIATNAGWNSDPALSAVFARTGASPFVPGSADAALVATLTPGTYSVQVVDGGGSGPNGGSALVEIYDAGSLTDPTARLMNLSSRGTVPANGTLIGGLVISGSAPKTLLIRGVGPALAGYGVSGVLADPKIGVYDGSGALVASNDDWQTSGSTTVSDAGHAAAISGAGATAGAFQFQPGSKDAALVITLGAGAYTVQVSGVGGVVGAAMIEVYELP